MSTSNEARGGPLGMAAGADAGAASVPALHSAHGRDAAWLRQAFLESMASSSTAVHVVTTSDGAQHFGVTVSACNSVCADPPTLLVCINTRSPACAAVTANGVFAVNLLSTEQRHIADTFAGRVPRQAAQADAPVGKPFDFGCCSSAPGPLGAPLIDGAVAALECRVVAQQIIGTHSVFFGEVVSLATARPRDPSAGAAHMPLLYCRRDYGQFQPLEQAFSTERGTVNDQNR